MHVLSHKHAKFGAMLVLMALPGYGIHLNILGVQTTVLELVFVGVMLSWCWLSFSRKRESTDPRLLGDDKRLSAAILILLLAAVISTMVAPDHAKAFLQLKNWYLEPALFFVFLIAHFRGRNDVLDLLAAACLPAIVIASVAIAQHFDWYPIAELYRADHRSTSLYSYANAVGLYLAPLIAACAVAALKTSRWRPFFITTILLSLPAIFFSQTEAAWLALAAVAAIYGFSQCKLRAATLGVVTLGMLALALTPMLAEKVIDKLMLQDFSGAVRRTTWEETSHFLNDHPLFGAGLGGYQQMMAPYHTHTGIEIFWFPHTLLLNFWVELGLLGVIALALLIRAVYLTGRNQPDRWLAFAPLLVMLIHGLFDVPFFKDDLAMLTFFLLAVIPMLKREPQTV